MDRRPVVAGQFYPGSSQALERTVRDLIGQTRPESEAPTLLAMVPHAGYPYSGRVAGYTMGRANLARRLVLLGPNHTGQGRALAVWPSGNWLTPLGAIPIDQALAAALLKAEPALCADREAHLREHSLEVLLPFLHLLVPELSVVPIAVAETRFEVLQTVAHSMAGVLAAWPEPVSLVVSSDMSHYVSHESAKRLDALALQAALRLDPAGLYDTVRAHSITMCGVLPMTLGLLIARELGASKAELALYATSGETSGDYDSVVGYAGVLVS